MTSTTDRYPSTNVAAEEVAILFEDAHTHDEALRAENGHADLGGTGLRAAAIYDPFETIQPHDIQD